MKMTDNDLKNLTDKGFIIKRNILNEGEVNTIKKIILKNKAGKGGSETYYPTNSKQLAIKLLKFDIQRYLSAIFFLKIKKKLELDKIASLFFSEPAELLMLDGYHNPISDNDILPWHSDQAYSGALNVEKISSPDLFYLKFFFYLTNVSPNNGCTSYIPTSHKITYAVRSCLYEKKIEYQPFWTIKDLVNIINKKENYNKIKQKLSSEYELTTFLVNAEKCISNNSCSDYDFYAEPGDVLIFNEGGVHKGSNPTKNERVVLRYLYSKAKQVNN
jgi:hypothetical protein